MIVGLAPGLAGANRTGRPFTGDFAGRLLYETLIAYRFGRGVYRERADDGLLLEDCFITNAVRCVPPENKPTPGEIAACRVYLAPTIASLPNLAAVVALGRIAHDSLVRALGGLPSRLPFRHAGEHAARDAQGRSVVVFDSYHCSRYNTNTGVLTAEMFQAVFARVRAFLDARAS